MRKQVIASLIAGLSLAATPAAGQIRQVDPNTSIDADIDQPNPNDSAPPPPAQSPEGALPPVQAAPQQTTSASVETQSRLPAQLPTSGDNTFQKDDLLAAAEGVFGKGAQGLGSLLERILKDQGRPNGYIVGREASGAFVLGLRYGSGRLFHKVEGERDVYWTGPSIGFDTGANASRTFVLVYNLYDTDELYQRFPAGEGNAYAVGGLTASYLRSGKIVLIPVRLGVGLRLGINAGYMKFTRKRNWLPL